MGESRTPLPLFLEINRYTQSGRIKTVATKTVFPSSILNSDELSDRSTVGVVLKARATGAQSVTRIYKVPKQFASTWVQLGKNAVYPDLDSEN